MSHRNLVSALSLVIAGMLNTNCGFDCSTTEQAWQELSRDIYSCESSAQCTTFEQGDYCSCASLVQVALRRDAISKVREFVRRVAANCRDDQGDLPAPFANVCDAAPKGQAFCESGRCMAHDQSCNAGPRTMMGSGGKGGTSGKGVEQRARAGGDDSGADDAGH